MAKKLEIIGNYFVVTDSVSGATWECPSKNLRYEDQGDSFMFYDTKGNQSPFGETFANITDSTGSAFSTVADLLSFLRNKTGGNPDDFIADETNLVAVFLLNGGSEHQAVNGSVTPVEFSYSPPAGYDFICARIIFYMESFSAMASEEFGDIAELTNGWTMKINGVETMNAKTNRDLGTYMYDTKGDEIYGKTNKVMLGRFSFNRFTDGADGITIRDGQSFSTVVKDDLSTLIFLEAKIMGVLKKAN